MKAIKLTSLLVVALALTFGATGCKKKVQGNTPIPGTGTRITDAPPHGIEGGGKLGDSGDPAFGGGPLPTELSGDLSQFNRDSTTLAAHTVHFAYDSSVIRSDEKANISAVAAYMKENPGVFLLVEGNCDERGTEEYNRALGDRRALAGREAIVADGVEGSRITTRSYGRDRPVATGNSESAMAQNRRDDFVVLTPK
jgi:peptidoglycan-associated lipoprotein